MDTKQNQVPDGGWGWVIVAAVALINMTNQSVLSVYGLLFGLHLQAIYEDTFTIALIMNLNSLILNFSGLFIGPLIKSFKPRNVASTGCLMVASGLFICAFANHLWQFIFGFSFLVGMGLGLLAPSTFMAINSYFKEKRGRAVGISLAGAGLGHVFMPYLVVHLLEHFNFHITVLTLSMTSLCGLAGALLLKPFVLPKEKHNNCQHLTLLIDNKTKDLKMEINRLPSQENVDLKLNQKTSSTTTQAYCSKICARLVQAMDLILLKDPIFWSIIIGMAIVYTATLNFSMLYPRFLINSVGLTKANTATCMSVIAFADILSRLVLPFITDRLKIPYRLVFLFGTIGLFVSRTLLAESMDMTAIIILSIFTGIMKSATVINNNLTISDYCSAEKLPGGLGLGMISKGVIVISIGQLFGWIRDYSDSYIIGLHAQNIGLLLVIIIWVPEIYFKYRRNKRNEHKNLKNLQHIEEGAAFNKN